MTKKNHFIRGKKIKLIIAFPLIFIIDNKEIIKIFVLFSNK